MSNDYVRMISSFTEGFFRAWQHAPVKASRQLADWEIREKQRIEEIKGERSDWLRTLRDLGVTRVVATYSGSGDSGQFDDIGCYAKDSKCPLEIGNQCLDNLTNFFDAYLSEHYAGYENNSGGSGEFVWEIDEDKLTLDHREYYEESNEYHHVL